MGGYKKLLWTINLVVLITCSVAISRHFQIQATDEIWATAADTAAISGSCDDPDVTAFIPTMTYTVTWSTPAAASAATCSATVSLTGNLVNGDSNPSVNCSNSDEAGFVILRARTPNMKLGGLQCQTQDRVQLEANGDGTDNTSHDIGTDLVSATDWNSAKQIDNATTGAKDMLAGSSGQLLSSALIDGDDKDALVNGEVEFGGTTASQGASRLFIKTDYTNYDVQEATDKETMTYTFTAQ